MSKKLMMIALATLMGLSASAALFDYQFNDADGTSLLGAAFTGTSGVGFTNDASNVIVTNGSLRISSSGDAVNQNFFAPLGGAVTGGVYRFEFTVDSWNLETLTKQGIQLRVVGSAQTQVIFDAFTNLGNNRMKVNAPGSGVDTTYLNSGRTGSEATLLAVELDLDAFTYIFTAGTNTSGVLNLDSSMTDISRVQLVIDNAVGSGDTTPWGAGDYIDIDSMSLAVVPEPATIGLVGVFGAVLFMVRRRRIR